MTQLVLIRHAVNDFVKTGKLAGWTPGVHLNDEGKAQADVLGKRLAAMTLHRLYSSPLERTMETAEAIRQHHPHLEILQHEGIGEVRYGDWEGERIALLSGRKMWSVVQEYPSRAYFPNGETMRGVQVRIVDALEELAQRHPRETVVIVSHADIIKMALAHYLGMHLDAFQRIVVSPASISIVTVGHSRPFIACMNDTAHVQALEQERKQQKANQQQAHPSETSGG